MIIDQLEKNYGMSITEKKERKKSVGLAVDFVNENFV